MSGLSSAKDHLDRADIERGDFVDPLVEIDRLQGLGELVCRNGVPETRREDNRASWSTARR